MLSISTDLPSGKGKILEYTTLAYSAAYFATGVATESYEPAFVFGCIAGTIVLYHTVRW